MCGQRTEQKTLINKITNSSYFWNKCQKYSLILGSHKEFSHFNLNKIKTFCQGFFKSNEQFQCVLCLNVLFYLCIFFFLTFIFEINTSINKINQSRIVFNVWYLIGQLINSKCVDWVKLTDYILFENCDVCPFLYVSIQVIPIGLC